MARAEFTKIATSGSEGGSGVLDDHIKHVDNAFRRLGDVVNNAKIQRITFVSGVPKTVFHGLGQPVTHYDVSMKTAPAHVYLGGPSLDPSKTIVLVADADVTVSIRFT